MDSGYQAMLDSVFDKIQDLQDQLTGLHQAGIKPAADPCCGHCGGKNTGSKSKCLAWDLSPSVEKELIWKTEGFSLSRLKIIIAYIKKHLDLDK